MAVPEVGGKGGATNDSPILVLLTFENFLHVDPVVLRFGHAKEGCRRSEPVRQVGPRSDYRQA
jgi:hypothetical protein